MEVGDTVKRIDPKGRESTWEIENENQLKYMEGLEKDGFKFEVVDSVE